MSDESEELIKEAANILSEVDKFGADDSIRRIKISRWLKEYHAAQQSAQADKPKRCENCGGSAGNHHVSCNIFP